MKKGKRMLLITTMMTVVTTMMVWAQGAAELTKPIDNLIVLMQQIAYPVGALMIIVSAGLGTIIGSDNPEAMESLKKKLVKIAVGLLIIGMAGTIVAVIRTLTT